MNAADECARTAADHAEANPLVRHVGCLSFNSHNISPEMLSKPKHTAVGRIVGATRCEIVKGLFRDADDMCLDELGAFARAIFRVFQRAFPLTTAQPSKSLAAIFEKIAPKSTCPSPSERKRPARFTQP